MKRLFVYIPLLITIISFNGCSFIHKVGTGTIECGLFDFECHSQAKEGQKKYEEQEKLRNEEKKKQEILRKEREQKLCKKDQPKIDCVYERKMLDGRIRSEVYYNKNGEKEGIEREWAVWTTEYGQQMYYLSAQNTYKNGKMIYKETFYSNGNPISQENLKDGKRYGWTKIYKMDGTLSNFIEYGDEEQVLTTKSWYYQSKEPTFLTFYEKNQYVTTLTLPPNPYVENPKIEYEQKRGDSNILKAKCLNGSKKILKTQQELLKLEHLVQKIIEKIPLSSDDYYICE